MKQALTYSLKVWLTGMCLAFIGKLEVDHYTGLAREPYYYFAVLKALIVLGMCSPAYGIPLFLWDFYNITNQNPVILDLLTYAGTRSFYNTDNNYAYPSYTKIEALTGFSRQFISDSINRLEHAGHLSVERSTGEGVCNRYHFIAFERFERVPYELFYDEVLTNLEKAFLLSLRKFFNEGYLTSTYDVNRLAAELGLTYHQVYHPLRSLIEKRSVPAN